MSSLIQLSIGVTSFAAEDPGTWQPLFDAATVADEAGVDRLVVSDHVVFGERLEEYARPEIGGQAGGKQPTGPDGHWLEPLTVLTALSSVTTRVRLATNILLASLRRPVVLAKTLSMFDMKTEMMKGMKNPFISHPRQYWPNSALLTAPKRPSRMQPACQ